MSKKFALELTRRRALGALLTIGAGSAAAGAGTFALFSDTESSTGNSVTAGTLDLSDGISSTSVSFTDVAPGDSGYFVIEMSNSGNIPGDLDVKFGDGSGDTFSTGSLSTNAEGDNPEAETNTNTSDGGELAENLDVTVHITDSLVNTGDSSGTTFTPGPSGADAAPGAVDVADTTANSLPAEYTTTESLSSTKYLYVDWSVQDGNSGIDNTYMGDEVGFDIQVELTQTS